MGHFNNPTIGHDLSWQDLNHNQLSPAGHVWHYIEDVLLHGESFDALIQDTETFNNELTQRDMPLPPNKVQGPVPHLNSWELFGQFKSTLSLTM